MASYDATTAQPPVVFPLSGPPVCVAFGSPLHPGLMRSVHDERRESNFIELNDDIHHATILEKFRLEPSQKHSGLLHVKCCSSNKYWVAKQLRPDRSHSPWFIVSAADEPEEDLDKPGCTLFDFRPHPAYLHNVVRIHHPQHNKYASVLYMSGSTRGKTYLKLRDDEGDASALNIFSVRGVSEQKELPRYVAFKGASGKYLTVKGPYLGFSSCEITDPAVVHETFTDEYGVIRIRSYSSGKFWRLRDVWISADSDDSVAHGTDHVYRGGVDTLFKVVVKDNNHIALQNISNGKFCNSTIDKGEEWLGASAGDSNTRETMLVFEQPIRSRQVYDAVYRVGGKKSSTNINVHRTQVLYSNTTPNISHNTATIKLHDKQETKWKFDVTAEYGIETHVKISFPIKKLKLEGQAGPHFDIKGEFTMEETKVKETTREVEYKYPVPPMTRVMCAHFTREDVVDVPFSYKQKVVLFNGEILPPCEYHDGVFNGVKSFDTDFDTYEEKIVDDAKHA